MTNEQTPKKQSALKQALFGAQGSTGFYYDIVYFSISTISTTKGIEQYVNLIYGDGQYVYTNMIPMLSMIFQYDSSVISPKIKFNKSGPFGGSKAEILLPYGFSFIYSPFNQTFKNEPPTASEMPLNTVEPDQYVYNPPEHNISTNSNPNTIPNSPKQKPQREYRSSPRSQSDVIVEDDFVATMDPDALENKIQKFLSKHDQSTNQQKSSVPISDQRSIEDIKKESVADELDRVNKNNKFLNDLD